MVCELFFIKLSLEVKRGEKTFNAFFPIVLQHTVPAGIPTRCVKWFQCALPILDASSQRVLVDFVLLREWSKKWNTMLYSKCNWICSDKSRTITNHWGNLFIYFIASMDHFMQRHNITDENCTYNEILLHLGQHNPWGEEKCLMHSNSSCIVYVQYIYIDDLWTQILNYEDIQENSPQSHGAEVHSCWPGVWYMVTLWLTIPQSNWCQIPPGMRQKLRNRNQTSPCGEITEFGQHNLYRNHNQCQLRSPVVPVIPTMIKPGMMILLFRKHNQHTFLPFLTIWVDSLGWAYFSSIRFVFRLVSLYMTDINIIQKQMSLHFP